MDLMKKNLDEEGHSMHEQEITTEADAVASGCSIVSIDRPEMDYYTPKDEAAMAAEADAKASGYPIIPLGVPQEVNVDPVKNINQDEEKDIDLADVVAQAGFSIGEEQKESVCKQIVLVAGDNGIDLKKETSGKVIQFIRDHKSVIFPSEKYDILADHVEV